MDLEGIRLFSHVAATGSILGAAATSGASRTTVRRKLEELEAFVGVPLVQRSGRGMLLTDAGRMLAAQAEQSLATIELAVETTRKLALDPEHALRFVIPVGIPPMAHQLLAAAVEHFVPGSRVGIRVCPQPELEPVASYDLCLSLALEIQEGPIEAIEIGRVDQVLIASPAYLDLHPPIRTLEDLRGHRILAWEDPTGHVLESYPTRGGEPSEELTPSFTSNDAHLLHEMVGHGAGIALTLHRSFGPEDDARFQAVLPDLVGASRPIRLLVNRGVEGAHRVKVLVDAARSLVQD